MSDLGPQSGAKRTLIRSLSCVRAAGQAHRKDRTVARLARHGHVDAKPVLPPADSPTIAYEVIDYIKSIGTIRTAVDGRIVLRS